MSSKRRQRFYTGVVIFLAVIMAVTLFLPGLAPQTPIQQNIEPTAVPIPTFPPPVTDFSGIDLSETYLHPSGLFTVGVPAGWQPNRPSNNGTQVQVNMNNDQNLTVIESYIEVPQQPVETLEALSDRFNESVLQAGWRSYSSWQETQRVINDEAEQLEIDFVLTLGRQNYIARHIAWLEEGVIKVVRVVAPDNARDLLLYLLDLVPSTLDRVDLFSESPTAWNSLYSPVYQHIIRYPSDWRVVDGNPENVGPITIEGGSGQVLRVEVVPDTVVTDEAAAEEFVQILRPNATIASVASVERGDASGLSVAYNTQTLEGIQQSGVTLLLNDPQGDLHVADVRLSEGGIDFNNLASVAAAFQNVPQILSTFHLTGGLGFPAPDQPVEADTAPEAGEAQAAPTTEVEAEPTAEADETAEGETADDETADDDTAAEDAATPEPTAEGDGSGEEGEETGSGS